MDRSLSGTQGWSGRGGGEKILCPYWESNRGCPVRSLVTVLNYLVPFPLVIIKQMEQLRKSVLLNLKLGG